MTLVKMSIKAFSDGAFTTAAGSFDLQFNPTEFSLTYRTPQTDDNSVTLATGVNVDTPQLAEQQSFDFDFTLDSTGVDPGCTSVPTSVTSLKTLCIDYNGEEHTSNFLKLVWGTTEFKCKCTSLIVNYILFKSDGEPVRAKIKAHFDGYEDPSARAARHNTSSPDMTHIRTIKSGDSLPLLCNEVYGDSKYYLQVAEANGIVNFRSLTPGNQVVFPRLEK
jgi:hypothetical protein